MRQRSLAWGLTSRRPRCCTNPTLQEPERRITWLMKTSWILFWNSPTLEALYQIMDALTMKYREGWPRLVHLSADYARESGTTTMGKVKIYHAIVLPTLLYGAEASTVYRRQVKKLHAFIMRLLRSVMSITWMDKVTTKDILERTGLPSMEDLLIRKNLWWTWHLIRMSPDRLSKQILYSQLSSGHREGKRAPSSPVQGYHQEKPEAERHKDRLMDITLTAWHDWVG